MIAPGRAQPADDLGVARDRARVRGGAPGGGSPATSTSSLIATGTPSSGRVVAGAAAAVGLVGLGQRALGEHDAVGVEQRVDPRDPRERRLDDLARGDLAVADQSGLLGGAGEGERRWRPLRSTLPAAALRSPASRADAAAARCPCPCADCSWWRWSPRSAAVRGDGRTADRQARARQAAPSTAARAQGQRQEGRARGPARSSSTPAWPGCRWRRSAGAPPLTGTTGAPASPGSGNPTGAGDEHRPDVRLHHAATRFRRRSEATVGPGRRRHRRRPHRLHRPPLARQRHRRLGRRPAPQPGRGRPQPPRRPHRPRGRDRRLPAHRLRAEHHQDAHADRRQLPPLLHADDARQPRDGGHGRDADGLLIADVGV